jgi:hypothetical protein
MKKNYLVVLAVIGECLMSSVHGVTLTEDFSSNPFLHGWKVSGDTNLFQWNSTNQNLSVTWDSAQGNSYFYHPLGTVLARDSDFALAFDLRLDQIGAGPDTNKATSFPISVGFINLDVASRTNFFRGTGTDSPDLAEFAYFWDSGFGATSWPTLVDTNSSFNYSGSSDYAILALTTDDIYHIAMAYTSGDQTLVTTITNLATSVGVRLTQSVSTNFTDFRLGSVSINSYSDAGQDPQYAGSVLAHGVIDNLIANFPAPPVQNVSLVSTNGTWQVHFASTTNWVYQLERSANFSSWATASPSVAGINGVTVLSDTNAPGSSPFYRVHAARP